MLQWSYQLQEYFITITNLITTATFDQGVATCTVEYNKRGWHCLPNNNLGLYTTPAKLQSIFQNTQAWRPVKAEWNIANPIPICTTMSANNAKQYSYNNCLITYITNMPRNLMYIDNCVTNLDYFWFLDGVSSNKMKALLYIHVPHH